jgi:hypothetical protein
MSISYLKFGVVDAHFAYSQVARSVPKPLAHQNHWRTKTTVASKPLAHQNHWLFGLALRVA